MDIFLNGWNRIIYYEQKKQIIEQLFKKRDLLEKETKEKKLPNYLNSNLNNKIIDSNLIPNNTKLDNLSKKTIKNDDELIKINQKLFLNYLRSRLKSFNLLYYIKKYYSFDLWNKNSSTGKHTTLNDFKSYSFNKKTQNLLTKYKNYYLNEAFTNNTNLKLIHFRLHLNPVRKNLSISKNKINNNTNKTKKNKNNKKTSSDW
ncbi:MAG: hypothetical protein Q8889_01400 [Candidatus Phytoplasma australasiaticum]|nr:hypothetical protein [Candidatus Phytoplasma australasiaticum]MDV3199765.1 hypothetical protein [Candidatus Phytoplasma australasiaticum]